MAWQDSNSPHRWGWPWVLNLSCLHGPFAEISGLYSTLLLFLVGLPPQIVLSVYMSIYALLSLSLFPSFFRFLSHLSRIPSSNFQSYIYFKVYPRYDRKNHFYLPGSVLLCLKWWSPILWFSWKCCNLILLCGSLKLIVFMNHIFFIINWIQSQLLWIVLL